MHLTHANILNRAWSSVHFSRRQISLSRRRQRGWEIPRIMEVRMWEEFSFFPRFRSFNSSENSLDSEYSRIHSSIHSFLPKILRILFILNIPKFFLFFRCNPSNDSHRLVRCQSSERLCLRRRKFKILSSTATFSRRTLALNWAENSVMRSCFNQNSEKIGIGPQLSIFQYLRSSYSILHHLLLREKTFQST